MRLVTRCKVIMRCEVSYDIFIVLSYKHKFHKKFFLNTVLFVHQFDIHIFEIKSLLHLLYEVRCEVRYEVQC